MQAKASGLTRVPSTFLVPFCFLAIALQSAPAQTSADGDQGWPQEIDSGGLHFVIYQPQADQWKKDHLEARAAITVTPSGDSTPLYGIVSLTARPMSTKRAAWSCWKTSRYPP